MLRAWLGPFSQGTGLFIAYHAIAEFVCCHYEIGYFIGDLPALAPPGRQTRTGAKLKIRAARSPGSHRLAHTTQPDAFADQRRERNLQREPHNDHNHHCQPPGFEPRRVTSDVCTIQLEVGQFRPDDIGFPAEAPFLIGRAQGPAAAARLARQRGRSARWVGYYHIGVQETAQICLRYAV
jgi:hypothetical protein